MYIHTKLLHVDNERFSETVSFVPLIAGIWRVRDFIFHFYPHKESACVYKKVDTYTRSILKRATILQRDKYVIRRAFNNMRKIHKR